MAANLQQTLQDITNTFLRMQSLVLEQLTTLRSAIIEHRLEGVAERVTVLDADVDALERELEQACLYGLALQAPVARDLRFFLLVFKSLADIERAGDYAKHVADDIDAASRSVHSGTLLDIAGILAVLIEMLERVSYAFVERDAAAAQRAILLDESVDALYEQMQRASLTQLIEQPREVSVALRSSRLGREIERLGDHLKNVAERILENVSPRDASSAA